MSNLTLPVVALSIQQPWAWLIANGWKDIENRDWATRFRGPVLIHAGKKFDADGFAWLTGEAKWLMLPDRDLPAPSSFERGGIVGVATITGCVTKSESLWFFGDYGFTLADARPLPFFPCRGALGFFAVQYPAGAA